MHDHLTKPAAWLLVAAAALVLAAPSYAGEIIHDAEWYVLEAQNGERWTAEDGELDAKLAELEAKFGTKPNIVHILWDDTSYGDVGIPAISKIRGFETPNCNRMADEGALFTRMYTEPSCTPSRAACVTGRLAVRHGMYSVGFPVEYHGLRGDEVTIAEVLSEAGYATAFYGKWHLGDIEPAYPHNQGFDETLFAVYNQVVSLWNPIGEGANAIMGLLPDMVPPTGYELDSTLVPNGWVMNIEGRKGELGAEWGGTTHDDYIAAEMEYQKRTLEFIQRNHEAGKPFYVASWPMLTSFLPNPEKKTPARAIYTDAMQHNMDAFIGRVMDLLTELGIAENTLVVAMADNGPMSHNPPPGLGMTETIFRGGKGDFLEGGVRVPAFAWWPGTVESGQLVGDIIHITDLYTTFARLGGALDHVPDDRIVDGLDQTALLLNGDKHGRRDFVHIYTGPELAATVKGDWKRHWISADPTDKSGIGAAFYFLLHDTREKNPMLVNALPMSEGFGQMRNRHMLMKEAFPDKPADFGPAYTGLSNARPETQALSDPRERLKDIPASMKKLLEMELPWELEKDPDLGQ